jgi:DNA-directed RNA polymerase specialized sigma24 family protein
MEKLQKPTLSWFYVLARQELARRRKALQMQAEETVPLGQPQVLPDDAAAAEGYDPEQPLDILERALAPPVMTAGDLLPDPAAESPAEIVARRELLAQLRRAASAWPALAREVFEIHFIEGFEPDEVAMVLGEPAGRAHQLIEAVQQRVRSEVLRQALV